jgi:pantoate--beta-alanine ligase
MGALHAGHMALVAEARRRSAGVAASIFVNPLQFGPNEDLARYPRDEAGDLARLREAGCDVAWLPPVEAMYPPRAATRVEVTGGLAEEFEGAVRPGHFRGVATVVTKLLNQAAPDFALFGEKDWQQLQVVRRLVADLDIPTEIVAVPTVREADGLALSSRNRFLSPAERAAAPRLFQILQETASRLAAGQPVAEAEREGTEALRVAGLEPDYLRLVEAQTLRPLPDVLQRPARLLAAARLGGVRLLDNVAA